MEMIRISDGKLKLMLTSSDMCHFKLDAETLGENAASTRRAFRRLLDEVRRRIDFEADELHISVQYFPSREGGCEMFISNLPPDDSETLAALSRALTPAPKAPARLPAHDSFRRDCAYRFERLDDLLAVCQRLHRIAFVCDSSAYRDEKGAYFLLLSVPSASPFSFPDELDFLVEYGSIQNSSALLLYIREHASPICLHSAIPTLAVLA